MMHQDTAYPSCCTLLGSLLIESGIETIFNRRRHCELLSSEVDILEHISRKKSLRMPPSPLLALPAELRLEIYEYALQEQSAVGVGGSYTLSSLAPKVFGGDVTKQAKQPPLLGVSRQLRRETLALFYRLNTFVLAVHYRRARAEIDRWIDLVSTQPDISTNLTSITIKHRFGILDFRGTIDFDLQDLRIIGPKLWFNAIPPLVRKEVESIVDEAHAAERTHDLTADTLRRLVEVLGIEPPMNTAVQAP